MPCMFDGSDGDVSPPLVTLNSYIFYTKQQKLKKLFSSFSSAVHSAENVTKNKNYKILLARFTLFKSMVFFLSSPSSFRVIL